MSSYNIKLTLESFESDHMTWVIYDEIINTYMKLGLHGEPRVRVIDSIGYIYLENVSAEQCSIVITDLMFLPEVLDYQIVN